MKRAYGRLYHQTRLALIRLARLAAVSAPGVWAVAQDNAFMRRCTTFFLNLVCRDFGTRIVFEAEALQISKGQKVVKLKCTHWIYALPISKDFDIYFSAVEPKQEGDRKVVDYSGTALQRFRLSGLQFEVSGFPEEEQAILDYFRWHRPQPGETVFDLGANCGLSVYYLSHCVGPSGTVHALEPDPINFAVLLRNIKRHNLTNVIPVRKAVAATTTTFEFLSEGTIGSTLAHLSSRPTTGTVEIVEALSLVDACRRFGTPTFVKMDIEGAEVEVLAAAQELLREHAIQFAIDTNHYKGGEMTRDAIEKIFRECGYQVFSSDESGFMTTWARKIS